MKNESNFIIADDNNNDEEMCFIGESEIKGDVIASFNFNSDSCSAEKQTDAADTDNAHGSAQKSLIPFERIVRNEFLSGNNLTKNSNGAACIINGESADIKKGYMLRDSTVRKLNELRSLHPDVNICLSTIVDLAIETYYKCIKEL